MKKDFSKIQVLALDVDGVLTDGSIVIGQEGELYKSFSAADGLGISIAKRHGLSIAIITGRRSKIVLHRAKELGITLVQSGITDKATALEKLAGECSIPTEAIAFMGDDLNDLPAMQVAGFAFAPVNAVLEVKAKVDFVTTKMGGKGAVRVVIEKILQAKNLWQSIVNEYETSGQGDSQ